jgi:hypothetical protein
MRYDLVTAHARCSELGHASTIQSNERLEVVVGQSIVLCPQNAEAN